ncbi:uncharacterized protein LOC114313750 [Camellia sinensis]|uniref:uncharacterized protein LOC114313750 n=1 Tax=Camellia sinensis TaxID=4442 RepID=UPI00103636E5|nr:uncharacterized protein LOC114313750 [Camellia sinensis]
MGNLANLVTGQKELVIDLDKMKVDLVESWETHLPLVEFVYNNSYHSSIGMTPYEALYGRPCRSPVCWAEVGDRSLLGLEIVQLTTEKIKTIRERLKTAQNPSHVIDYHHIVLDDKLTYEERPIRILDWQVKQLRNREIPMVKIELQEHYGTEATWEREEEMQYQYPYLFLS